MSARMKVRRLKKAKPKHHQMKQMRLAQRTHFGSMNWEVRREWKSYRRPSVGPGHKYTVHFQSI
jgi:hypothetical protein